MEFRYAIETHPNKAVFTIHTNIKVNKFCKYSMSSEQKDPRGIALNELLCGVPGVIGISSRDYAIQVEKGGAFSLDEVKQAAVLAVYNFYNPACQFDCMVEVGLHAE